MSRRVVSRRSAIVAGILLLPFAAASGVFLMRWLDKPLFASAFRWHEMAVFPAWSYSPWRGRDAFMFERRVNAVLVVVPGQGESLTFSGSRRQLCVYTDRGDRILVAGRPNSLTLISPDLSVRTIPLEPGEAERLFGDPAQDTRSVITRVEQSRETLDGGHVDISRASE